MNILIGLAFLIGFYFICTQKEMSEHDKLVSSQHKAYKALLKREKIKALHKARRLAMYGNNLNRKRR